MTRSSGESTDEEVLGAEEQLSRESRNWYKVNEQTQQHCWLLQETVANVVQDRLCWQKTSIRRHPPRLFQHCKQGIQWTALASGSLQCFRLIDSKDIRLVEICSSYPQCMKTRPNQEWFEKMNTSYAKIHSNNRSSGSNYSFSHFASFRSRQIGYCSLTVHHKTYDTSYDHRV